MSKLAAAGLESLSAVLAGAALAAAYAGPLRFEILGHDLSIRTLSRPAIAAFILLTARLTLFGARPTLAAAAAALARVTSGALIAAGVIGWATYLSQSCGGADSYGYVSAAERLLAGDIVHEEPLANVLPFANGIRAACPLGYVPSARVANASVPAYPLGLPGMMAVAIALFGRAGPFLVSPLLGVILLGASSATAFAWYRDRQAALLAPALLAVQPLVFTYAIQPMSDVPAAAALMVAVAALSRAPARPRIAGAAAALALLIRPALAPAALALAIVPWSTERSRALDATVRYAAPVAAAVVLLAWTQWHLYGGVLSSGYGEVAALFSANTVLANARSYSYWGFLTLGPAWITASAIGFVVSGRLPRLVLVAITLAVVVPYLFYRPYDHWETLRFLLPVFVIATIIAAHGLLYVARGVAGEAGGALVASVIAVVLAFGWMSWLSRHDVFAMPTHEARHRIVGELVGQTTPQDAVILALQHSGSVRYYAGRQTLNWERIPTGSFVSAVKALQDRHLAVFLLLDSQEERAMFEARHGTVVQEHGWLPTWQRRSVQLFEAPPSPAGRSRTGKEPANLAGTQGRTGSRMEPDREEKRHDLLARHPVPEAVEDPLTC
jgi:hypothetical protein